MISVHFILTPGNIMHELTQQELYLALQYAKSIDEESGKRLMIKFEIDQPMLFQTVFNTFSAIIGERHQEIAHIFLDACFEIFCIYQKVFGAMPNYHTNPTFMERQALLLDKELKPMMEGRHISEQRSQKMRTEFFTAKEGEILQTGLIGFYNETIDDFLTRNECDPSTIELTKTMLFVVMRLLNNLYTETQAATVH
jgi:hypothetical protein